MTTFALVDVVDPEDLVVDHAFDEVEPAPPRENPAPEDSRTPHRTAPYFHNGYFRDLRSVVDFDNTRDVKDWPAPEIPETVNHTELGSLGLTDAEVDDLLAFLGTLDDGYTAAH